MTRAREISNVLGRNIESTTFTATAGQTAFSIAHTENRIQVFMNGLLLDQTVDWTSDGSTVTLTSGATAGDEIEVVKYDNLSVANVVPSTGGTFSGDVIVDASVGIGTSSPSSYNSNIDDLVVSNAASGGITIATGTASQGAIAFADGTSGGSPVMGRIRYDHSNNSMGFRVNNDEKMSIDSAGRVTTPYQPAFLAYMDHTSTSHSGGTDYNDIFTDWTGTSYNTGSHFVLSTGRFTAPVSGKYFFSAAMLLQSGQQDNNDWAGLNLIINGTSLSHNIAAFGEHLSDSTNYTNRAYRLSLTLSLNASDYVELSMDSMNGTGQTFRGSFSGYLLG